jgi:collagenase-like PrtC family protease
MSMHRTISPSLTMGPVYYLWNGPKWRDFHFRIAEEAPIERVVIGETVCSKRQHFIEPHIAEVIERLEAAGKTSICLPPELPFTSVEKIVASAPAIAFEIFAFGRMPLAISARCAHARSKGKIKDNCQFGCGEDPDGLPVKTLDRQSFLAINGVQTVAHTCQALLGELAGLAACGISAIRLSPQDCDMMAVAKLYRAVLDNALDADEAIMLLREIYPTAALSNGFHHAREGAAWVARARDTAHGRA